MIDKFFRIADYADPDAGMLFFALSKPELAGIIVSCQKGIKELPGLSKDEVFVIALPGHLFDATDTVKKEYNISLHKEHEKN